MPTASLAWVRFPCALIELRLIFACSQEEHARSASQRCLDPVRARCGQEACGGDSAALPGPARRLHTQYVGHHHAEAKLTRAQRCASASGRATTPI